MSGGEKWWDRIRTKRKTGEKEFGAHGNGRGEREGTGLFI